MLDPRAECQSSSWLLISSSSMNDPFQTVFQDSSDDDALLSAPRRRLLPLRPLPSSPPPLLLLRPHLRARRRSSSLIRKRVKEKQKSAWLDSRNDPKSRRVSNSPISSIISPALILSSIGSSESANTGGTMAGGSVWSVGKSILSSTR